jgi:hypothetical protein
LVVHVFLFRSHSIQIVRDSPGKKTNTVYVKKIKKETKYDKIKVINQYTFHEKKGPCQYRILTCSLFEDQTAFPPRPSQCAGYWQLSGQHEHATHWLKAAAVPST